MIDVLGVIREVMEAAEVEGVTVEDFVAALHTAAYHGWPGTAGQVGGKKLLRALVRVCYRLPSGVRVILGDRHYDLIIDAKPVDGEPHFLARCEGPGDLTEELRDRFLENYTPNEKEEKQ